MKFGLQLGINNRILVGNLNKKGTEFLNKEDKSLEVLSTVIELINENDKKSLTTELKDYYL